MTHYDAEQRRLVLDIGIAGRCPADRNSYLQQLSLCFRTRARTELPIGAESTEHEWLQVEGGLVDGKPVRCRVFVIPSEHSALRDELLRRCSALIFTGRAQSEDPGIASADISAIAEAAHIAGLPPVVIALLGGRSDTWAKQADSASAADYQVVPLEKGLNVVSDSRLVMTTAIRHAVRNAPEAAIEAADRDFTPPDNVPNT